MTRALLGLTLVAAFTTSLRAETCAPVERTQGPPVYAILHGYPYGPPAQLQPLTMVDHDLVNMAQFFQSLGPRRLFVHGEATRLLHRDLDTPLRPATWRALLGSVGAVVEDIRSHGEPSTDGRKPQVYVYFVGHGLVGTRDRLELFARPDGDGPGYDGDLDSKLIAEHIVRPLSAIADVHLIADTCFGYHLVQTRSAAYSRDKLAPRPPLEMAYAHDFARTYPGVGALLATRELTQEHGEYGGLFSHMVRSLAIGVADLDRDGIVTYGEMARALPQAVPDIDDPPDPHVIAPGFDANRPFVDWRATPAAQSCFPGDMPGKYILIELPRIYATVHLPETPRTYWLPRDRTLGLDTWGAPAQYFVAEDGPVRLGVPSPHRMPPLSSVRPPASALDSTAHTAEESGMPPVWEPLPTLLGADPTPSAPEPPVSLALPFSAGIALLGGVSLAETGHLADAEPTFHADLAGRVGYDRHQLLLEAAYAWASVYAGSADVRHAPAPAVGHRVGGRAGYGYLLAADDYEASVGLLGGLHQLWGADVRGPAQLAIFEVAARGSLGLPFDHWSRWALRLDVEVGAAHAGAWIGPTARLSVGVDFEALIR